MSIYLTSSKSSTMEPLRQNRFILQFSAVPGASPNGASELAFMAHTASRPTISFEETVSSRLNEQFYVAGKPTWETMSVEFYDYISTDSSSQIIYDWSTKVYNPITGQMGFKKDYSTSATLAMLDPAGGVVEVWNMFYIWPQNIAYNELSTDSSELMNVSVTFRYDFAVKANSVDTSKPE